MTKRNVAKSRVKVHAQSAPRSVHRSIVLSEPEWDAVSEARMLSVLAGHPVPEGDAPWLRDLALAAALTYGMRTELLQKAEAALAEVEKLAWAVQHLGTDDPARRDELREQAFTKVEQASVALLVLTRNQRAYEQDEKARARRVEEVLEAHRARAKSS